MSIKRMSAVWELSQHKGSELLLLLSIADNADDEGYCWPGTVYLAQKTRVHRTTVLNIIKRLEKTGELAVSHNRRRGNRYVVTVGLDLDTARKVLITKLHKAEEELSSVLRLMELSSEMRLLKSQSTTSEVAHVQQEPSITAKEPSLSPSAIIEDIETTLDSLGLTRTFEEGEIEVGNWRDNVSEWSAWGGSGVRARDGVSEMALRHTGWIIEQHTDLFPMVGEWKGWCKGLAEIYLVTGGDFDAIERAVEHGWDREPKYRPNHPRGFVNAARQKPGEPKKDEGPVRKYRDITDRDVAIAAAKRVNG